MTKSMRKILLTMILFSQTVLADDELKLAGDLMIHPDQIAKFFEIAAAKISASPGWDWPAMNFTQPYKTYWTGVAAKGPFAVRFDTRGLKNQEVAFELEWLEPTVSVTRFEIHDTIRRQIGGVNLTINLDGACNNMLVRIPDGRWKVKGNLKWIWSASGPQVSWKDFAFTMNSGAVGQVELGQCEGPAGLMQELRTAIETASRDQSWMQDVLRDGVLDFVTANFGDLQKELLKPRVSEIKKGLALAWVPQELADGGQGLMRVGGHLVVSKTKATSTSQTVERGYDVPSLASVTESGFVLPRGTIPRVTEFMQRNGEISYRAKSNDVEAFVSLMQSRFMQFFVWPDLMSFDSNTQFYFDLSSEKAPTFAKGVMLQGGGIQYEVTAPLLVNQWAPAGGKYLPYVDFKAPLSGTIQAKIEDGEFKMKLSPSTFNVWAGFRQEYNLYRRVTAWIATSLLGSRVQEFLEGQTMSLKVPAWTLGEGINLTIKNAQLWKYSFRVPLEFKNSK